jgi:hypothetical protein
LRHIKDILEEAGITLTPANRKQIDQAVHKFAGIAYKNCPDTWEKVKNDIRSDAAKRRALVKQLQKALG